MYMERKEYSAGAVKHSFWFMEFRNEIKLLSEGKNLEEIRELCKTKNIFAASTPKRAIQIFNTVSARIRALGENYYPVFLNGDVSTQKLFNLAAIMAHLKVYQKRPIYWLFDSGKQNGFKALIYMHRYNADTIGNLRVDYLHHMERIYESEINRMQDMVDNSSNAREVTAASKRKEKLQKQLKECQEYDEKISHLALSRIEIDLDDGVKVNYEKVQTARDGKKYQVLAKI